MTDGKATGRCREGRYALEGARRQSRIRKKTLEAKSGQRQSPAARKGSRKDHGWLERPLEAAGSYISF